MTDREEMLIWRAFAAFAAPILAYVAWGLCAAVWLYIKGVV
jgi:hypothetical protein